MSLVVRGGLRSLAGSSLVYGKDHLSLLPWQLRFKQIINKHDQ